MSPVSEWKQPPIGPGLSHSGVCRLYGRFQTRLSLILRSPDCALQSGGDAPGMSRELHPDMSG